ncbi:MAG: SprT family zinc-dependent metalloprotease [Clostridiales bacterium]|nr:SprT family zinc-dependent metalloprotease [Clostridiales bacterium]
MNSITIEDIQIEIIKKNIKNLYLSVHPPYGRVRIAAPIMMDDETIRIFAISKLAWIKKQRSRYREQERQSKREFVSGESHYYEGVRYLLNVVYTNKKQRVETSQNRQIDLYVRDGSTVEQREKVMMEWYRSRLKDKIPDLIAKWERKMGVNVNSWGVKLMKTKWGTCNPYAKRIWINLELAKKNPRCLEYIVVHEMAHLLEKHHNERFRAYMDQFMPDWREIKAELNNLIFESSR